MCDFIESKGYPVFRLPQIIEDTLYSHWLGVDWKADLEQTQSVLKANAPVDWLIVDHYGIDKKWESPMRSFAQHIMVIDDLADRAHDCDYFLDQNLIKNMDMRYNSLVPKNCKKMLGPQYALLREEFIQKRKIVEIRQNVKRVLVFMGGSDPSNETAKVLASLGKIIYKDISVDVVVGINNAHQKEIEKKCEAMGFTYHCQVDNIGEMMCRADLAIGGGGSVTWERAFLGLPSIVISIAENQEDIAEAAASEGFIYYIGMKDRVSEELIREKVEALIERPNLLRHMSERGLRNVDGHGVERVLRFILK
jgi:UDP-2,4-diacetamido-2,4,6-trideoxy-beta-L-altropyranose hydrolase